jgi:hypothetical protein
LRTNAHGSRQRVTVSFRIGQRSIQLIVGAMTDDAARDRAIQILVRSLYRDLKAQGFADKHILAVAIELVGKVTDQLSDEQLARRA